MKTSVAVRLAPWLATIALFVVWEAVCRIFNIPVFFLPPPSLVFKAVFEFWPALYRHSLFTLSSTLVGFAMAVGFGLLLGLAVGWSRAIYAGVYPLMIGFNAIPKVAVVPILVLWFGIGFIPAVLTAFLISFFPIVVNVATGLATIEPELEDVLKALGASKLDIMRKVGIPRTLPYFFGSLKIAITLAFVGSVISESIASNYGIGNLMLQAQAQFQVPLIFAGLIALAIEGIVMYWLMAILEARSTRWAQRSGFARAGVLGSRRLLAAGETCRQRRRIERRNERLGELLALLHVGAVAHIEAQEHIGQARQRRVLPDFQPRQIGAALRQRHHGGAGSDNVSHRHQAQGGEHLFIAATGVAQHVHGDAAEQMVLAVGCQRHRLGRIDLHRRCPHPDHRLGPEVARVLRRAGRRGPDRKI